MSQFKKQIPGRVNWEDMKAELMELSKDTLVEMISMWVKNYWSNQSYWMIYTERDFGFEHAGQLDMEVWEQLAQTQAGRLKTLLNLDDDVQALALTLKYTAPQWAPAGFDWQIKEISDRRLTMEVKSALWGPIGTARD